MTQKVNTRYERLLRGPAYEPVYLVIFDDIPTRFSTGPVKDAIGTTKPYMRNLSGGGAQVTVSEGRTSLANRSFSLLDISTMVTQLAFEYQLANRIVTIKAGFANLSESDYVILFVGRILNYTLSNDNVTWTFDCLTLVKDERKQIFMAQATTSAPVAVPDVTINAISTTLFPAATAGVCYLRIDDEVISYTGTTPITFTGCLRGQLGTVAATHDSGAQITNLVHLQGNPLTLALQIMMSTGTGSNGDYDVLPACAGLGIDQALVAIDKFTTQRDQWLSYFVFQFEESERVDGKTFLEEQIYTFCNSYPVVDNYGRLSIKVYGPPLPNQIQQELNNSHLVSPPVFAGSVFDRYFFNEVDLSYDYDFISQEFASRTLYDDPASQAIFDDVATRTLTSRGIRTGNMAQAKIDNFALRFLKRFAIPSPILQARVLYSRRLLEASDIVPLTSDTIPNLATGKMGVDNVLMEIIGIEPDDLNGIQTYTLLNTGYSYGRKYAAISPSAQAPINFPDFSAATPAQKNYAFISQKINATKGIMGDGSDGYYITG